MPPQTKEKKNEYRTRWCAQNWCEGTKAKTFRGDPAPTCKSPSDQCACPCHQIIDQMFEIAGLPRVIQDLSEWRPPDLGFVMPDRLALMAERRERRESLKRADAPGAVVHGGHVFTPTPTGSRGRGQLEYQVLEALHDWPDQSYKMVPITPALLSGVMAEKHPPAPSTGAIHAIWIRWRTLKFCDFQNRPAVFLGFIGEGTVEELDKLKLQ